MEKKISALTFDAKEDGWEGSRGFVMRQVEMPTIDEEKTPSDASAVIIKMRYAGVCGSDRGIWQRMAFKDLLLRSLEKEGSSTRILGHEFLGEIVAMGSKAAAEYHQHNPNGSIAVGSLVSGDSHIGCGICYQCQQHQEHVCINESILGISTNGVFAEYAKLSSRNLWPVDITKIRPEIGAILDPFGNAVHAVSKVAVQGQEVALFGSGPISLFAILLLKHFGAKRIIALDVDEKKLLMTKTLGADETILIEKESKEEIWQADKKAIEKILQLTQGKGVDIAMEMAGPASSVNNTIECVRRGGHVILFGIKDGAVTIPKFSNVITKGITLHATIGREIFKTWESAQTVLEDTANGIQEKIWNIILEKEANIVKFSDFQPDSFEKTMQSHTKVIIQF